MCSTAPGAGVLSSAQISPRHCNAPAKPSVTTARNGRYVKIKIPGKKTENRGDRKPVGKFSRRSRRALLDVVNQLDRSRLVIQCGRFVTLTYPLGFPDPRQAKRHLEQLLKRHRRAFGPTWIIWKLEPQDRLAPHFHLLLFSPSPVLEQAEIEWWARNWHDIAGGGDLKHLAVHLGQAGNGNRPCIEQLRDWNGVTSYATKYMGKVIEQECIADPRWRQPGRWWGIVNRKALPITLDKQELGDEAAAIARRAMVRYYEHQQSGKVKIVYPSKSGRRVHRGFYTKQLIEQARQEGAEVLHYNRRWPRSRGGVTVYMDEATALRIVQWAQDESLRRAGLRAQRRAEIGAFRAMVEERPARRAGRGFTPPVAGPVVRTPCI